MKYQKLSNNKIKIRDLFNEIKCKEYIQYHNIDRNSNRHIPTTLYSNINRTIGQQQKQ